MKGSYLGPRFKNNEIENELKMSVVQYLENLMIKHL